VFENLVSLVLQSLSNFLLDYVDFSLNAAQMIIELLDVSASLAALQELLVFLLDFSLLLYLLILFFVIDIYSFQKQLILVVDLVIHNYERLR